MGARAPSLITAVPGARPSAAVIYYAQTLSHNGSSACDVAEPRQWPHLSVRKRGGTSNNNENGSLGHRGNTTIPRRDRRCCKHRVFDGNFFPIIFVEKRVKITGVVPYTPLNLLPLSCTVRVCWGGNPFAKGVPLTCIR